MHPTEATWTVPRTRSGLRRLRADLRELDRKVATPPCRPTRSCRPAPPGCGAPNISPVAAATLLAEVPELGACTPGGGGYREH